MAKANSNKEQLIVTTKPNSKIEFELIHDYKTIVTSRGTGSGTLNIKANTVEYTPNSNFSGEDVYVFEYTRDGKVTSKEVVIKVGYSFKARSHILSLLGDELIGNDTLAIFELVKNAYDADAEEVAIIFEDLNTPEQSITIEDDGSGMTLDILQNVWLEIGTDYKRGDNRKPSKKFNRLSLGEKGVGRLAVHKLGKSIILETQAEGTKFSHRLSLNWQNLIDNADYIDDTFIRIERVDKSLFKKDKGTRIIINELNKVNWERGELRDLARKVISIKSPFKQVKGGFNVKIISDQFQKDIDDIKDTDVLLKDAIYYFDFELNSNDKLEFAALSWNYKFQPPKNIDVTRNAIQHKDKTKSRKSEDKYYNTFSITANETLFKKDQIHLRNEDLKGIGNISGRFYVYNLLPSILKAFGQSDSIKLFVNNNSGVKVFRDGIRVYNYGEPNDDWLGLSLIRVNQPGLHFSKNITIGAIEITQEGSFNGLKEKTNREGFDENHIYLKFKSICNQIFNLFEKTAQNDRDKLSEFIDGLKSVTRTSFPETINELNEKLKAKNIDKEIAPLLKRVEKDYNHMRDVMLNSGMTGLNLGIVFHEVDREVRFINANLKKNINIDDIKQRVKNLIQLLENFSPILRQNKNVTINASSLVDKARNINLPRFNYHKIIFSSPLISKENEDFQITGPENLLISALSNIIDNAIYWVSNKKELEKDSYKPAIFIGSDTKSFDAPAIIIADNGNGFNLDPEDLVRPYRTTRPGGMGLGLYFVNLVMEIVGGKLFFPFKDDIEIPPAYTGAILALVFPKRK